MSAAPIPSVPAQPCPTLRVRGIRIDEPHRVLLGPTSLTLEAGQVLAVGGDPGVAHSAFALALGGRLTPDEGRVELDGDPSPALRQRAVALVDVPAVSEPDGEVPIGVIVGEELAMAGRRAHRAAVAAELATAGIADLDPGTRTDSVPTADRIRLLLHLASLRPGAQFLVLVLPERWGVLPGAWEPAARALAARGFGVLVTTGLGTAHHLSVPATRLEHALDRPELDRQELDRQEETA